MPYIKQSDRSELIYRNPENAGELNFAIHLMLEDYLIKKEESYQTYNDMMGVLAGVQAELYRRKIAPYEDKKAEENGDIYFYNKNAFDNQ